MTKGDPSSGTEVTEGERGRGHDASLAYHQRMIDDTHRLTSYERAIRQLVRPGDVVLDLGAGTGILSMLAARRGARVHAVESMPVAELARALVAHNGLQDRVTVHHADARSMVPVEKVDLVISDFMGRFVVDDHMLGAMQATRGWAKADTRYCPAALTLMLAPAAFGHFAALDCWQGSILGLDFAPVRSTALNQAYGADCRPDSLLAEPAVLRRLRPPDVGGPYDSELSFTLTRAGRLRGAVGWFVAELADGVSLTSEPGVQTHWGQLVFPLPATHVAPGDRLAIRLWLETVGGEHIWHWSGTITRSGEPPVPFRHRSKASESYEFPASSAAPPRLDEAGLEALNLQGCQAFEAGDYAGAAALFEQAVAALTPDTDHRAGDFYENLGFAYFYSNRFRESVTPFLRALDGALDSREQSLRKLVDACHMGGRHVDGARYLEAYEAIHGPHPGGWRSDQGS